MAIKTGIIFCTLLLGSLAVPVPENDLSEFFPETRSERIIGGVQAPRDSHPWNAAISIDNVVRTFVCSGAIISQRTILTAAHCIFPLLEGYSMSRNARVIYGTNTWTSMGRETPVSWYAINTQYNPDIIKNDIGMLFPFYNILYSYNVRAIPVSFEFVGAGVEARVAGWGATVQGSSAQSQLQQLDVTTIEGSQCVNDVLTASANLGLLAPPVDPALEICTAQPAGAGVCTGDSGSALVRRDRGQLIGISSWGFPCARGAPDVYVRVSNYQAWYNSYFR